jgi:rhodanese-related sulfurtransferase
MLTKPRIAFAAVMTLLGAGIALASLKGEPARKLSHVVKADQERSVLPTELAGWIVTGKRDFVVLDMREAKAYEKGHIRGAVHCQSCHQNRADGQKFMEQAHAVDLSKKIVIYSDTDAEEIRVPKIVNDNPHLYRLKGGYRAWSADVLSEIKVEQGDSEEQIMAKHKRSAVRDMFLGKAVSGQAPTLKIRPVRKLRPHKGPADEGS